MDRHHIIPRYKGGSNRIDNIVEVSRTCHVMWHFANWQLWGNKEDFIAYRGLAGSISVDQINREVSSLAAQRQVTSKIGIHGLTLEQRREFGKIGGYLGGARMSDYKWITNGKDNSRIPLSFDIPEGWYLGVTRKKPRKNTPKYGTKEDWNKKQRKDSEELMLSRLNQVKEINLEERGSIAKLSRLWGISHSQVRRYLNKIGV